MTPAEAIKILDPLARGFKDRLNLREKAATKLGIEALRFFKDLEDRGALPADVRLPGETKE